MKLPLTFNDYIRRGDRLQPGETQGRLHDLLVRAWDKRTLILTSPVQWPPAALHAYLQKRHGEFEGDAEAVDHTYHPCWSHEHRRMKTMDELHQVQEDNNSKIITDTYLLVASRTRPDQPVGYLEMEISKKLYLNDPSRILVTIVPEIVYVLPQERGTAVGYDLSKAGAYSAYLYLTHLAREVRGKSKITFDFYADVDSLGGARIVDEIYAGAEGVCLDEPNVSKGLTEIEKTWV